MGPFKRMTSAETHARLSEMIDKECQVMGTSRIESLITVLADLIMAIGYEVDEIKTALSMGWPSR